MAWQALKTAGSLKQISCRVAGCEFSMETASIFYQRSRCCPDHASQPSICPTLLGATEPCRFCQKCGRFHSLTKFDGDKKSCRKQLQEHNARRKQARLALEKAQHLQAAAAAVGPEEEEEDIMEDIPPPKSTSKKKGPRRKPSPPKPTAAAPAADKLEDQPSNGEILKSNWANLFPNAPTNTRPAAPEPPPATKTQDGNSTATGTGDGDNDLSKAFDRSYSLEDDPVVALPNEDGILDDDLDDETPPLPSGDDWWSPPKKQQEYVQGQGAETTDDGDYLMETAPPPTAVAMDVPMSEPKYQQTGGDVERGGVIEGGKQQQPLSPRFAAALAAASIAEYGEHYSKLPFYMYRELYDRIKGKLYL